MNGLLDGSSENISGNRAGIAAHFQASVTADWEELDNYLVNEGLIAPYGHRKLATFVSDRIDFDATIFSPVYYNDYTSFELVDGE